MRCVLIGALALAAFPFAPLPQDHDAEQEEHEEHEDALHENMEVIEETLGKLRRELRDPANHATALERVVVLQHAVLACKSEAPPMAAGLDEALRPAFVNSFRQQMVQFMRGLLELEEALLNDDNEAAQEALRKVREMEDPGHEQFTDDE